MASNNDVLSDDVVYEVLTRTSLQGLGSSRMVCKEWNDLTYDSHFAQIYNDRTKTVSGYFVQSLRHNKYSSVFVSIDGNNHSSGISLNFLPVSSIRIEASCKQGILLCANLDPQSGCKRDVARYYVCKPSTKQSIAIPNPLTGYEKCSTGIMVLKLKPLQYKIVRFSKPKYRNSRPKSYYYLRCEVFDSKMWAWKVMAEDVNLHNSEVFRYHPAVSAYGALHWFTNKDRIVSFYTNEEALSISSIPAQLHGSKIYNLKCLAEYQGGLALICSAGNGPNDVMEIWTRDQNHHHYWSKKTTVEIKGQSGTPEGFYNADVVIMRESDKVVYYNFKKNSYSEVELKDYTSRDIFEYRSDLEPTNLMGI